MDPSAAEPPLEDAAPLTVGSFVEVRDKTDEPWRLGRVTAIQGEGFYEEILVATEDLLDNGYLVPTRTVYLCFGHDEEVGGPAGAKALAAQLEQRHLLMRVRGVAAPRGAHRSPLSGRRARGRPAPHAIAQTAGPHARRAVSCLEAARNHTPSYQHIRESGMARWRTL